MSKYKKLSGALCVLFVVTGVAVVTLPAFSQDEAPVPLPDPGELLDQSISTEVQINSSHSSSQARIDTMATQTDDMLQEWRVEVRRTESLREYNENLERVIASQLEEMDSIEEQLEELENTNRDIVPLMLRMVEVLEQSIRLDMPFRLEARLERIDALGELMDRADVTTSEKYRQTMDVYQTEMAYGRTMSTYRDKLPDDPDQREVDFLQVGRIALVYQSLDGDESGWFNPDTRQWEELDSSYNNSVRQALRVARQQAAPELLMLPVAAPERAQ